MDEDPVLDLMGDIIDDITDDRLKESEDEIFNIVKKLNNSKELNGDETVEVTGDETVEVTGDETVELTGDETVEVTGDETVELTGDETVEEVVIFECPICSAEVEETDSECPGCGAIFEDDEEDIEELLDEELSNARNGLVEIRDLPISPDALKDLVKQSVTMKKEGDLERALEKAVEANDLRHKLEEFVNILSDSKKMLKKMKENGMDYMGHMKDLKDSKNMVELGDVHGGLESSRQTYTEILKKIG